MFKLSTFLINHNKRMRDWETGKKKIENKIVLREKQIERLKRKLDRSWDSMPCVKNNVLERIWKSVLPLLNLQITRTIKESYIYL